MGFRGQVNFDGVARGNSSVGKNYAHDSGFSNGFPVVVFVEHGVQEAWLEIIDLPTGISQS